MVSFTLRPLNTLESIWICGCIRTRTAHNSGTIWICKSVINSIFFVFPRVLISSSSCFTKEHELRKNIRKENGHNWLSVVYFEDEEGGKMAGWWWWLRWWWWWRLRRRRLKNHLYSCWKSKPVQRACRHSSLLIPMHDLWPVFPECQ